MVFSALKLRDQRNSCHCGLTWNSGKCADDKIPACGYVPGLVWNEYLVPAHEDQQKRQNRFLSAQFKSAASTFHCMRNEQRGHSQGGGRITHIGVKTALDISASVGFWGFFCTLFENMVRNHVILWWLSWRVVWVSFFLSLCYLMDYFISHWMTRMADPILFRSNWNSRVSRCTVIDGRLSSQRLILRPALRKCYSWSRPKGGDLVVITEGSEICGWRYLEMEDRVTILTAERPSPEGKPLWNGLFAVWL